MHAFKTGLSFTFHYDKLYVTTPFPVPRIIPLVSHWRRKNPFTAGKIKFMSVLLETWEERRLRVFENSVLRRVFGPKRDEVTGDIPYIYIYISYIYIYNIIHIIHLVDNVRSNTNQIYIERKFNGIFSMFISL